MGWFDISTLKEPYRIEGKKTMGLELAEQFDWRLPDVILYPTGGGTGLIGMWKAFAELAATRLAAIGEAAADGGRARATAARRSCAAFERGERFAEPFANAATIASGLRVPAAVGDFMMLDAIRASGGLAIAVAGGGHPRVDGTGASPRGPGDLPRDGRLHRRAGNAARARRNPAGRTQVVIFNTGAAQKYPEAVAEKLPRIDITKPIDWDAI